MDHIRDALVHIAAGYLRRHLLWLAGGLAAWGALFWLGLGEADWRLRLGVAGAVGLGLAIPAVWRYERRLRCPHCRKKLPLDADSLLAFQQCPNCYEALFQEPAAAVAFPGCRAFPQDRLGGRGWLVVKILAALMLLAGFGLWGGGMMFDANPDIELARILYGAVVVAAGIPAVVVFWFVGSLIRSHFLPVCPDCGRHFYPRLANLSGHCSSCGGRLLETFPPVPGAVLRSASVMRDYDRKCGFVGLFACFFLSVVAELVEAFCSCGNMVWLGIIIGGALPVWGFCRWYARGLQRRWGIAAGCPSCGERVAVDCRVTRCPHCGRQVVVPIRGEEAACQAWTTAQRETGKGY